MTLEGKKKTKPIDKEFCKVKSPLGVEETVARLRCILAEKRLSVFFIFDHSKEAFEWDLKLGPAISIMFGSPAMRTRLLQEEPRLAVLLPLRVLIWQDEENNVWLGYLHIMPVAKRFGVENMTEISYMEHMMDNIAQRTCHPCKGKHCEIC